MNKDIWACGNSLIVELIGSKLGDSQGSVNEVLVKALDVSDSCIIDILRYYLNLKYRNLQKF